MRKTLLVATAGLAVVGAGVLGGAGRVQAASPTFVGGTFTKANCSHNFDPIRTQNAITATSDPSRAWDAIGSVAAVAGPDLTTDLGASAIHQVGFTITLCAGATIPDFAAASANASSGEFDVCLDSNAPIASSAQEIGVGHRGGPIFDGPYDPNQGWKLCAQVNFQADPVGHTNSPVWGVETFDPEGQFLFFDQSQLKDSKGAPTISAPSCGGCVGANSFTIYFPYTWEYQSSELSAPEPPLVGAQRELVETMLVSGTVNNVVAESQIAATVDLPSPPAPICLPLGIIDCIQGVGGELVLADTAPGDQNCTSPGTCPFNDQKGFDLGFVGGFPIGAFQGTSVATEVGTYNDFPEWGPGNHWGTVPGQPTAPLGSTTQGQDQGDLCSLAAVCANPGPAVPTPYEYVNAYGRIIPSFTTSPLTFGSPNPYHIWGQFLPSFFGFTA